MASGVTDLAGRTHLVDPDDLREMPLCGYLGDVGAVHPVDDHEYLCQPCAQAEAGQAPTILPHYREGQLDV